MTIAASEQPSRPRDGERIRRQPELELGALLPPPPGGARQLGRAKTSNTPCPSGPKRAHGLHGPRRDNSAQRLGSWRAIENSGIAAGACDQLIREYARACKVNRSGVETWRKMSGQRMEGAALIVQTEHAVMVVSIGICDGRFGSGVPVGGDRRRFIHIQRVVADQGNDPRHLPRNHEEHHQAGAEAADGSYAGQAMLN